MKSIVNSTDIPRSDTDAGAGSSRTLLIGLGRGGSALLPYLIASPQFELVGACDSSSEAIGIPLAQMCGIPFSEDPIEAIRELKPDLAVDATGDPSLPGALHEVRPMGTSIVTGEASRLLWELLSALEARRRSDRRYDRLLSDMNSGVVAVQSEKIRYVNPAFLRMFDYTLEHVLGRPYASVVAPDFRERDVGYFKARVAGRPAPEEYETHIIDGAGKIHEVTIRARLSDWDGKPASLVIISDVSKLRELQREREKFFRFMVHELRAPLSPLVTTASLLKMPATLENPERLQKAIAIMDRSVLRLQSFIDDFLDLSKLDQETLALKRERVDLHHELDAVVENQGVLAEEKGLSLDIEEWQDFTVEGDHWVIRTILQNLVNNAIKYTDEGGVTVSVARDGNMFALRVQDTGAGLAEEEKQHLFQEFGRIKRTSGVKGTGLGLALVNKLVSLAGGRVDVESPGKERGSTFSVWLPLEFGG